MTELNKNPILHFNQTFSGLGIATKESHFEVLKESSLRVVIENADTNNVIRCESKLMEQSDWTPIGTIGANGEIVLNTSRIDLVRFIVEVYHPTTTNDYPNIIVSGFTY